MTDLSDLFRVTETNGQPPNYRTLHCACGDGCIWRVGDESEPWRDWVERHYGHVAGPAATIVCF